ncbi:hypothetical protein D3C84_878660 [compost metagenome]
MAEPLLGRDRDLVQFCMPECLCVVEGLIVTGRDLVTPAQVVLAQHLHGEIADEGISATDRRPEQVATLTQAAFDQSFQLFGIEQLQPAKQLDTDALGRTGGPRLQQVAVTHISTGLSPVPQGQVTLCHQWRFLYEQTSRGE